MMKKTAFALIFAALAIVSCNKKEDYSWIKTGIDTAHDQLLMTAGEVDGTGMLPRTIAVGYDLEMLERQLERSRDTFQDSLRAFDESKLGQRRLCNIYNWVSGFFPGSLWLGYGLSGDPQLEQYAAKFTNLLEPLRYYKNTHDLGFMVRCSFGEAMNYAPADSIKAIMSETAENLAARFDDNIGCIRSWDFGPWNFPVIIDNMMNLDLLYDVAEMTGNERLAKVATTHAETTMANHFREDCTCWHVVSYNSDGSVQCRQTFQGKNDDSAWARGQAWAVYGYTRAYVRTGEKKFLDFAQKVADMIMTKVTSDDAIPYWDYNAPVTDETPRDASAAAVTASALIEMSTLVKDGGKYFDYAEKILKNLSSPAYLAKAGENAGFILMHSTGSLPNGSEIDVPLSYADYYYLEALKRYMAVKGLKYSDL